MPFNLSQYADYVPTPLGWTPFCTATKEVSELNGYSQLPRQLFWPSSLGESRERMSALLEPSFSGRCAVRDKAALEQAPDVDDGGQPEGGITCTGGGISLRFELYPSAYQIGSKLLRSDSLCMYPSFNLSSLGAFKMQGPIAQDSSASLLRRALGLWPYLLIAASVAGLAYRGFQAAR